MQEEAGAQPKQPSWGEAFEDETRVSDDLSPSSMCIWIANK